MAKRGTEKFGTTTFLERGRNRWFHLDADENELGGPYGRVQVHERPLIATVEDFWGSSAWIIDQQGREIAKVLLKGNRRHHEDGPGKIVWAGDEDEDVREATAIAPDGTVIGIFEEIHVTPFQDVRWVRRRRGSWRLLDADGRFRGLRGITHANDFFDGLALVRIGKVYAFLTTEGRRAWRKSYPEAYDFYQGRAWVREPEGLALIGVDGERITQDAYDDVQDNDEHPYTIAEKGTSWYLVRRQDGMRVSEGFDEIRRIGRRPSDACFEVRTGQRRERLNVSTGHREPVDLLRERAQLMAAMGIGGEFDD